MTANPYLDMIPEQYQHIAKKSMETSSEQYEQLRCDWYNAQPGKLELYDCPDCLNRGNYQERRVGETVVVPCTCMDIRKNLMYIKRSGIADVLDANTFDKYETTKDWQLIIKRSAMDFAENPDGNWFYAGGQPGAGKTHICTAILGSFLSQGIESRYMLWMQEINKVKTSKQEGNYSAIEEWAKVPVLYIDDLFKPVKDKRGNVVEMPSAADVRTAFELLNYRYCNRHLVTIISSEWSQNGLLQIDGATGSRIYERSKNHCHVLKDDEAKNYRMRGE